MKIIVYYLPQFHEIPENNLWWGTGFTEWVNVKNAKKLFKNHNQPRIPLNKNYYDLTNISTIRWQVDLANKYGIYGFCIYHYWFNGKVLLGEPLNIIENNKDINLRYCISWANESWTNGWVSDKNKILIKQEYGNKEEWDSHFMYLLKYFKDERYIKEENKPLLIIYRPEIINCLKEMLNRWNTLAQLNGFNGIKFVSQHVSYYLSNKKDNDLFTYNIEYQPTYAQVLIGKNKIKSNIYTIKNYLIKYIENIFKIDIRYIFKNKLKKYDYDEIWNKILELKPISEKSIPGAFVDWDNTPRRGVRGIVYENVSTKKFQKYLIELIRHTKDLYKKDKIFLFAWNEWAEGGYLEPDERNEYCFLEAIKNALIVNNEFDNK